MVDSGFLPSVNAHLVCEMVFLLDDMTTRDLAKHKNICRFTTIDIISIFNHLNDLCFLEKVVTDDIVLSELVFK